MTECDCDVCRACEDERSAERIALHAWADETPPGFLRARVLTRAIATPQLAPAPATTANSGRACGAVTGAGASCGVAMARASTRARRKPGGVSSAQA